MDADPHVDVDVVLAPHVLDELDHVEAHVDAVAGVLGVGQRHPRHAVVAVAQDLDPKAAVLLKNVATILEGGEFI